jgi:hypothetical protein
MLFGSYYAVATLLVVYNISYLSPAQGHTIYRDILARDRRLSRVNFATRDKYAREIACSVCGIICSLCACFTINAQATNFIVQILFIQ